MIVDLHRQQCFAERVDGAKTSQGLIVDRALLFRCVDRISKQYSRRANGVVDQPIERTNRFSTISPKEQTNELGRALL